MIANLVECSDRDTLYGFLTVENVSAKEVQNKINEVKIKFDNEGFNDWCIEDIFKSFPDEWKWQFDEDAEIIAI